MMSVILTGALVLITGLLPAVSVYAAEKDVSVITEAPPQAVASVSSGTHAVSTGKTGNASGGSAVNQTAASRGGYFNGGEMEMLANQTASQMESFVLTTASGKLIVVDGGTEEDSQHLRDVIYGKGGEVAVWLITHPHSDHVGALTQILNTPDSGIRIDSIYYHFADLEWYRQNESYRAQMVADLETALGNLSPSALHPNIQKGDVIDVDDARITVMNNPYLFQNNAINNSSVVYKIEMGGKKIMFLGDLGAEAGNSFLNEHQGENLKCDVVQMAHHGENGVGYDFYKRLSPSICFWCAPEWLWTNNNGTGNLLTLTVRTWMRELGVNKNYVCKDGDQILK